MDITIKVSKQEMLSMRKLIAGNRSGDGYYSVDGDRAERVDRRLVLAAAAKGFIPTKRAGTCSVCCCTEKDPCNPPCAWTDQSQTLCTACEQA